MENEKVHICESCNKSFKAKWMLVRHMNNKNECVVTLFTCPKCGRTFTKKDHLNRHLEKKTPCINNTMLEQIATTYINNTVLDKMTTIMEQQNDMYMSFMNKINGNIILPHDEKLETSQNINSANKLINAENSNNTNIENSNNAQTVTNSNNSMQGMNNSCLINYVVNNYPNAKNIEDCIKLENIPKATLIECEDQYFTEGAIKIFKSLCDLGEEYRPIHCTDANRCNYIYKSNDIWKIDVGGEAIKKHFFPVIQDAYTQVHKKRIKDNPGNSLVIGNYLTEMTGTNVRKICQKTLKRVSNDFLAKNSKNGKLVANQIKRIEA